MVIAGLLLATTASAFQPSTNQSGHEVSWDVMPVHWAYEHEGSPDSLDHGQALMAVREAFNAWNAVPGARVRFIEDDGGTPADELNVVYWDDDWKWDPDILALTSTWSKESGTLVQFSIAMNGSDPDWDTSGRETAMDLQNALAHEVGHALGLAHDNDHGDATMAPTAAPGETRKRDLHRSDEAGARYLYPGAHGEPLHCSTTHAPTHLWWVLGLGLAGVLRTRRRPSPQET